MVDSISQTIIPEARNGMYSGRFLFPEADTYAAHHSREDRETDRAPERADRRASVAPLDIQKSDPAPQIVAPQSVEQILARR
jgi:hypothetical protein